MLGIPVHQNGGCLTVLCSHCMSKLSALKRDLEVLKQKARATYDSFSGKENVGVRKRTKNASGSVVSLVPNEDTPTTTNEIHMCINYYEYTVLHMHLSVCVQLQHWRSRASEATKIHFFLDPGCFHHN